MENNLPPVFTRIINLHKFEKMMKGKGVYMMNYSKNMEEFKYKLIYATLLEYIGDKYDIDFGEIPYEDTSKFIKYLVNVFNPLLEYQFNYLKKKYSR